MEKNAKVIRLANSMFVTLVSTEDYERIMTFSSIWYLGTKAHVHSSKRVGGKTKTTQLSRFIMNAPKGREVDHINGNSLDNRKCNLRICTRSQNLKNRHRPRKSTASKYEGVSWYNYKKKKLWRASLGHHQRKITLGIFRSEQDAARAINIKKRELYGDDATLNNVPEPFKSPLRHSAVRNRPNHGISHRKVSNNFCIKLLIDSKWVYGGYWENIELARKVRDEILKLIESGTNPQKAADTVREKYGHVPTYQTKKPAISD